MRWWLFFFVLFVSLVGYGVRSLQWHEPLWTDEIHTAWCVTGPWDELSWRTAAGNQAPSYFALAKIVVAAGGKSAGALRILSLISGCLIVACIAACVACWTRSPWATLAAGWLAAWQPNLVFYSIEARPYGLLSLIVLIHLLLALAAWQLDAKERGQPSNRTRLGLRIGWALTAALSLHLHYTAVLVLTSEWVVLASWFSVQRRWREVGWPLGLMSGMVALAVSPLMLRAWDVAERRDAWASFVKGDWAQSSPIWLFAAATLIGPFLLWLLDRGLCSLRSRLTEGESTMLIASSLRLRRASFLAAVSGGVWVIAALATWTDLAALLYVRYVVATFAVAPIVAGLLLGTLRNSWLRLAGALTLVVLALNQPDVNYWWNHGAWPAQRIEPWDEAVAWIDQRLESDEPILLFGNLIEDAGLDESSPSELREYCRFPLEGFARPDGTDTRIIPCNSFAGGRLPAEGWDALLNAGEGVVLVRTSPTEPILLDAVLVELDRGLGKTPGRYRIDLHRLGALHLVWVRQVGEE